MKLIEKGAIVLTLSDSKGYIYEKDGITSKQLEQVTRGRPPATAGVEGSAAVQRGTCTAWPPVELAHMNACAASPSLP